MGFKVVRERVGHSWLEEVSVIHDSVFGLSFETFIKESGVNSDQEAVSLKYKYKIPNFYKFKYTNFALFTNIVFC